MRMSFAHDLGVLLGLRRVRLADAGAILEVADGLVGAGDDRLALANPSTTSKYSSPAMPTLTGRNVACPSRTTNTPSASLPSRLSLVVSTFGFSFGTRSWSRTVSAMIGMLSALDRVSVTIRAVQLRSGRMSRGGLSG